MDPFALLIIILFISGLFCRYQDIKTTGNEEEGCDDMIYYEMGREEQND